MNTTKYIVDLIVDSDALDINELIREALKDAGVEVIAVNANEYDED